MRILKTGLVKEFNVRPSRKSKLYAKVHVYRSLDLMRKSLWSSLDYSESPSLSSYRYTLALVHVDRAKTGAQFADLWLSATCLDAATLSHEATHLALEWARRRDKFPGVIDFESADEPLCYAVGTLTVGLIRGTASI